MSNLLCVGCVCNVAAGGGRQAVHPLSPSTIDIGGGGIALQALLLTLSVCTSTILHRALQCVPDHIHRGTCAGIDMLCFGKKDTLTQIIMILVSKFPNM